MKKRGFEVLSTYQNLSINLPKRNTAHSAGYDFECAKDTSIKPGEIIALPTGIKAYMQEGEVLQVYARSSLAMKKQLVLINSVGIIDKDYYNNPQNEGHIQILLRNFGDNEVFIAKGERIAQGIFTNFFVIDNEVENNIKRLGGFGSTGQ